MSTVENQPAASSLARAFGWNSVEQALAKASKPRRGMVLALSKEAISAAALFAELTGRAVEMSRRNLPEFAPDVDVIVGLACSVDERLVERILDVDRPHAVGLVLGRDLTELHARAIAVAISARSHPVTTPRRVALHPEWPVGHVDAGLFQIFGADSSAPDLRTILGAGDTLITLAGHGDGIDGELAGGLVLCPHDPDFAALAADRQPLCRITGRCYRLKTEMLSPAFWAATLNPAAIVTRALIWNSCVGWPARDGFIDRRYGVGLRLATSSRIGALLTTDRVVIAPRGLTEPLIASLLRGASLGSAVARHNRSPEARRHGHRLLIFDDPDCRIAPELAMSSQASPPPSPAAATRALKPRANKLSRSDQELQSALVMLLANAPDDGKTDDAWACLQGILKTETLEGYWARTAHRIVPVRTSSRCPYCGLFTTGHDLLSVPPVAQRRIVRVCPRCEVISDTSASEILDLRISRKSVEMPGGLPPGPWRAATIIRTRWPMATTAHAWPLGSNHHPESLMPIPDYPTELPAMVSVVVHRRQSLAVFSRAIPGSTTPDKTLL